MKKEVEVLLLSGEIDFETREDKKIRVWLYPPVLGEFIGNSKIEVLEQIIKRKKENKRKANAYFKLPNQEGFIDSIRRGKKINVTKAYKIRTQDDLEYWQFNFHTESMLGEDWLHKIYYSDYFEMDSEIGWTYNKETETSSYVLKRNKKEIDWNFWKPYKKLVDKWELKHYLCGRKNRVQNN